MVPVTMCRPGRVGGGATMMVFGRNCKRGTASSCLACSHLAGPLTRGNCCIVDVRRRLSSSTPLPVANRFVGAEVSG